MTQVSQGRLDDILDQLVIEHSGPSPQALAGFLARYPEYREAIITFAAAWSEQQLLQATAACADQVEEATIRNACARFEAAVIARDTARKAASDAVAKGNPSPAPQTLSQLAQGVGIALMDLVAPLKLDVGVVAKLDKRLIRAETLPRKLVEELARLVGSSADAIMSILSAPPAASPGPAFMIIRSVATPTQESFSDALKASTLSVEAKAYWLSENS